MLFRFKLCLIFNRTLGSDASCNRWKFIVSTHGVTGNVHCDEQDILVIRLQIVLLEHVFRARQQMFASSTNPALVYIIGVPY